MLFRDDWERKAHDIICTIKYGRMGGNISAEDVEKVADILRGHSLRPPRVTLPKTPGSNPPPMGPRPAPPAITLPRATPPTMTLPKLPLP